MTNFIVVVGLGNISKRHRANIKKLFPKAQVIAVSSREQVPATFVSNADIVTKDIKSALEYPVDFSVIASPAPFHASHSDLMLQRKIPLLIEKPVTSSSVDAAFLRRLTNDANVPVAVGYCLRYLPSAHIVKAALKDGMIGQVYNVTASIGQFLPEWRPAIDYRQSVTANAELGGGALWELSHEFDYLQWLFGDLSLSHAILRNSIELGLDVEELVDVVMRTENGIVCNVHLDLLQKYQQRTCSVVGAKGRLDWDLINNTVELFDRTGKTILYEDVCYDKNLMYLDMLKDFERQIHGESSRSATLEEAHKVVSLIEAIKESASVEKI